MQDVAGKVAFITGGASGVGFALAVTFAQVGMKIVLADMRPEPLAASSASDPGVKALVDVGMDPLEVGRRVLRGILHNDLYILTHPEIEPIVRERFEAILAALPDEAPDPARLAAEAPTLHYSVYTEHKKA